jgi:hypothetical protein
VVSKRTLVIIAAVAVLAVLGAVLAITLPDSDSGSPSDKKGGSKAAASASATAGGGNKGGNGDAHTDNGSTSGTEKDGSGKKDASPTASKSADDSSDSSDDKGAASTHKSGQGYSIGLPEGWKFRSSDAAGDRYTGPDGQRLLIGWTSTPKGDPVADWSKQERYMVRPQYKRVSIKAVDFRGWNTADWEFTYVDGGTTNHVVDRGFVVNAHLGYGLMYTAKADDWDSKLREDTWKTLTRTFQPKS